MKFSGTSALVALCLSQGAWAFSPIISGQVNARTAPLAMADGDGEVILNRWSRYVLCGFHLISIKGWLEVLFKFLN